MRFSFFAVLLCSASLAALVASSCDPPRNCDGDSDCGAGLVCTIEGNCAQCDDNGDCAADSFCCRGACRNADDINTLCGCGPASGANPGTDCGAVDKDSLCLVGDVTATAADVAQGTCGCGCTPAEGGPICGEPALAGGAPVCSCAENIDCRGPTSDATGRPHSATDTCTPDGVCVCFAQPAPQAACDADGATPDCTSTGCRSLDDEVANCGVPGRVCSDPAQGTDDGNGVCVDGGCECNVPTDCIGANLNVDGCKVFQASTHCVCDGYEANSLEAPCPLGLVCAADGCLLDGIPYATQDALLNALQAAN